MHRTVDTNTPSCSSSGHSYPSLQTPKRAWQSRQWLDWVSLNFQRRAQVIVVAVRREPSNKTPEARREYCSEPRRALTRQTRSATQRRPKHREPCVPRDRLHLAQWDTRSSWTSRYPAGKAPAGTPRSPQDKGSSRRPRRRSAPEAELALGLGSHRRASPPTSSRYRQRSRQEPRRLMIVQSEMQRRPVRPNLRHARGRKAEWHRSMPAVRLPYKGSPQPESRPQSARREY